jgi:hypothetical protein
MAGTFRHERGLRTGRTATTRAMLSRYIEAPARQAASLRETGHRPWPAPDESWLQGQTWEELLFAHWQVDPDQLRRHLPRDLEPDTYDGAAWLGITPFRVAALRLRGTLPLPLVSTFLELNVRTYVTVDDKPGIWFFSLDAASPLAVRGARRGYRLPYHDARMEASHRGGWIEYSSSRATAGRPYVFEGRYRAAGNDFHAQPGSLEHFLTERYCLYTVENEQLARAEIHHPPWPLRSAQAEIHLNTMAPDGVDLPDEAPLAHFAECQDVVIWPLRRLA